MKLAKNPKPCRVGDCGRPAKTRGMCGMHAERVRRYESTTLPTRDRLSCSYPGCERKYNANGWCAMHERRARRRLPMHLPARGEPFAAWVPHYTGDPAVCWEWPGARDSDGYGKHGRRAQYAHRLSYEHFVGPIPEGLQIDHLCRNRACVNPGHLEAVPQRVNILRGTSPAALVVRTNRCKRGHEFTPANTYYRPDGGGRQCRECIRLRTRRKQQARSGVAA